MKLPAEGLWRGLLWRGASFPLVSAEGPDWLAEKHSAPCSPPRTHGGVQATETLSIAPGPARPGGGGGSRPQKEAAGELQGQTLWLHSFLDHLLSPCCGHGTEILWDELRDGGGHELGGKVGVFVSLSWFPY